MKIIKVSSDESNFFWADFNLLVELQENALWAWWAKDHFHGTTMGGLAVERAAGARKCQGWEELAQWTHVSVIPHQVLAAALRRKMSGKDQPTRLLNSAH